MLAPLTPPLSPLRINDVQTSHEMNIAPPEESASRSDKRKNEEQDSRQNKKLKSSEPTTFKSESNGNEKEELMPVNTAATTEKQKKGNDEREKSSPDALDALKKEKVPSPAKIVESKSEEKEKNLSREGNKERDEDSKSRDYESKEREKSRDEERRERKEEKSREGRKRDRSVSRESRSKSDSDRRRSSPREEKEKEKDRKHRDSKEKREKKEKRERRQSEDQVSTPESTRRDGKGEGIKLQEEAAKLKRSADNLYKNDQIGTALHMYLLAGLKFMESASLHEVTPLLPHLLLEFCQLGKSVWVVPYYCSVVGYCSSQMRSGPPRIIYRTMVTSSTSHKSTKCIAATMSRVYVLKNDRVKRMQKELKKLEPESPLKSIKELEEILRSFDMWYRAEHSGAVDGVKGMQTLIQEVRSSLGDLGTL